MEVSGYHCAPAALPPGRNHGTHGIGGRVGHRAGVKELETRLVSCLYRNSNPGLFSCQVNGRWLIGSDRGKAKCLEEIASQLHSASKSNLE
jgi:hypothetical protein